MSSRWLHPVVLAAALLASFPVPAPAQVAPTLTGKLRLALPYAGGEALDGADGVAALLGGSATLEVFELAAVEAGGTWLDAEGPDGSWDVYARLGVAPVLHDGRAPDGAGWTVQGGALWGWRFRNRTADTPDGRAKETCHAFTATASLEGTYWWAGGVGLNLRTVLTFGIPLSRTLDDPGPTRAFGRWTDWFVGGGLMAGLAF